MSSSLESVRIMHLGYQDREWNTATWQQLRLVWAEAMQAEI